MANGESGLYGHNGFMGFMGLQGYNGITDVIPEDNLVAELLASAAIAFSNIGACNIYQNYDPINFLTYEGTGTGVDVEQTSRRGRRLCRS